MTHELKLCREFAEPVFFGDKRFEIRENDRGYQKGDTVIFKVVDINPRSRPLTKREEDIQSALEKMQFTISYVISGWGLKNGRVAFGLAERI